MTLAERTEEVLKWTRFMNSLNISTYMNDWVSHHSFIRIEIQIEWYKVTGRIPQPHNGGHWITFEHWREMKIKLYNYDNQDSMQDI